MSVILEQYNPHDLEPKVQEHWKTHKTFKAVENLYSFLVLSFSLNRYFRSINP